MDSAVSTAARRQWMMTARGNATWISPAQRKLNGILSVTRAALGAIAAQDTLRQSAAALGQEWSPRFLSPYRSGATPSPRSLQKFNSPPARRPRGCMETICSTRVVPERGMPMISTGVASLHPEFGRLCDQFGCAAGNQTVDLDRKCGRVERCKAASAQSSAESKCCIANP